MSISPSSAIHKAMPTASNRPCACARWIVDACGLAHSAVALAHSRAGVLGIALTMARASSCAWSCAEAGVSQPSTAAIGMPAASVTISGLERCAVADSFSQTPRNTWGFTASTQRSASITASSLSACARTPKSRVNAARRRSSGSDTRIREAGVPSATIPPIMLRATLPPPINAMEQGVGTAEAGCRSERRSRPEGLAAGAVSNGESGMEDIRSAVLGRRKIAAPQHNA